MSKKKAVPKHCTWGRDRKGEECSLKPVAIVGYNDKNKDALCRLHKKLVLEWVWSAYVVKSLVAR